MLRKSLLFASALLFGFIVTSRSGAWMLLQCAKSTVGRSFLSHTIENLEKDIWESWESSRNRDINAIQVVSSLEAIATVDITKPFLIKNLSTTGFLTPEHLVSSPIGDLEIDYFTDARLDNTVPDARATLRTVAQKIMDGGVEKFGTQMIVKRFPSIVSVFVEENPWLTMLFGETRTSNWKSLAATVTVPVFMSRGRPLEGLSGATLAHTTRTDLHCEPISNVVVQTAGRKIWTLIAPEHSALLRPTVAPDGRAYFYSRLDPTDPASLHHVPRYEVVTERGDVLYVPTWTWHRVEYLPDTVALSLSLFEFLPWDYLAQNPLLAATLVPNLLKEALGIKMQ